MPAGAPPAPKEFSAAVPDTVNLLVLTSQANDAQDLITVLRNSGLPAHGSHAQHPEQLVELAASESCDLILCCVYDPKIDLQAALKHHQRLGRDVPLLLITDGQARPETLIEAMHSGARDLIERDDRLRRQVLQIREELYGRKTT